MDSNALARLTGTILIMAGAARSPRPGSSNRGHDENHELMEQMDVFLAQLIASVKAAAALAEQSTRGLNASAKPT